MNDKQQRFVTEYIKDSNATQAAIRAGYSEKTARSQGQRLLTNVDIEEEVSQLREQVEQDAIATHKEVCEYLTRIIRANIADFLDEEGAVKVESIHARNGEALASYSVRIRSTEDGRVVETTQIKTRDTLKAVDLLSKLRGYYSPERHESLIGEKDITDYTDEELMAIIARAESERE